MTGPTEVPGPLTVREGALVLAAQQRGSAFLLLRDADSELVVHPLPAAGTITLGRHGDVALPWDPTVSRVHAELVVVGDVWTVVDDGLSRNGVFVNGERLLSRRRLRDGDTVRVGETVLAFRGPRGASDDTQLAEQRVERARTVTAAQRQVLVALCRPVQADPSALPASNDDIAAELVLSVDAVKGHLRQLFARFGLTDLPPTHKRIRLAQEAMRQGLVRLGG